MSQKQRRVFWPSLALLALALSTIALVRAHSGFIPSIPGSSESPSESTESTAAQTQKNQKTGTAVTRNLSLQPEAFNLGRRLGKRFSPDKREQSSAIGTLTIGGEQKIVHTARKQTDDGEQVEIKIEGSPASLTWESGQGALSSGAQARGSDRDLIERLVLDGPDQFVLAQLRGASYYTVARNVRPANADDKYAGPLWDIVRVSDPESDDAKRPQSRWRLYYVNVATGLIDRIESEVQGRRIRAEVTWTDVDGEKVPAQIVWKSNGQTLMTYGLANFSHAEK